ncbi:hypothetical protein ACFVSW_24880 [Neobacillus sp. NPDC058068]|uniref:hypothetical protein n=1 Tax=Neobacillus sp. NPDC058068 TaxID=3346325 RepID=UPI0036DD2AC2
MKFFIKLNTISALYAIALYIAIELIINVTHISKLTGWEWDNVYFVIAAINVIGLLLSTILFICLTKKWTIDRKYSYLSILLWAPYFILFFSFFPLVFPINTGVALFPRFSLLIYGSVILYPVYILFINLYASPLSPDYEEIRR